MPVCHLGASRGAANLAASIEDILGSHRTGRPVLVGILNVTPDSFSDGGEFLDPASAVQQARKLAADGADVLDVGAESTRPGSQRVSPADQIARLREVLPEVVRIGPLVSIDTTRPEVAEFALAAGAVIVNDVSAGREDPRILRLAGERGCALVLMHMLGQPKSMQENPTYHDVVAEVRDFLSERLAAAESAGVPRQRCIVDPGIGFGKRLEHNLALLGNLQALTELGCPVMVGPSRKRFIGELTDQKQPSRRVPGTVAACVMAQLGGATIFRVHDVAEVLEGLRVAGAIRGFRPD
jgi:dihydropteroate synthase